MTKFITSTYVSRVGRLGNSLLQIAASIAYGLDNNKQFLLTKWDYSEFIELPLNENMFNHNWERVAHNNASYEPLKVLSGDVDLHGHFLSQTFFKHRRKEILDTIKLIPHYEEYIQNKFRYLVSKENTCSIHVRRGDYLQQEQLNYHGVLPLDYYTKAISILKSEHENMTFIICSDDISWCKENFKGNEFVFIEGEKDIIDLFLMSKFKHNIIANSTFSWWSAWLNQHPENKVIAPIYWFTDPVWDDLYRENWIKI